MSSRGDEPGFSPHEGDPWHPDWHGVEVEEGKLYEPAAAVQPGEESTEIPDDNPSSAIAEGESSVGDIYDELRRPETPIDDDPGFSAEDATLAGDISVAWDAEAEEPPLRPTSAATSTRDLLAEAERLRQEAERRALEEARARIEDEVRRQTAEATRRYAEEEAARRAAEEAARAERLAIEEAARAERIAAEAALSERLRREEEERSRQKAEEQARAIAELDARRIAAEEARIRADEEARQIAVEETRRLQARLAQEEETRLAAEAAARELAEQEQRLREEQERAVRQAEEQERLKAEQEAAERAAAEAEALRIAEEEEKARLAAEAEARRVAEEEAKARLAAEAEARRVAEEEAKARLAAEAEARRVAEEQARALQARLAAEEAARRDAEMQVMRAAEEKARNEAVAAAHRLAAEEEARLNAELEARLLKERLASEEAARARAEEERAKALEAEKKRMAAHLAAEQAAQRAIEVEALRRSTEQALEKERQDLESVRDARRDADRLLSSSDAAAVEELADISAADAPAAGTDIHVDLAELAALSALASVPEFEAQRMAERSAADAALAEEELAQLRAAEAAAREAEEEALRKVEAELRRRNEEKAARIKAEAEAAERRAAARAEEANRIADMQAEAEAARRRQAEDATRRQARAAAANAIATARADHAVAVQEQARIEAERAAREKVLTKAAGALAAFHSARAVTNWGVRSPVISTDAEAAEPMVPETPVRDVAGVADEGEWWSGMLDHPVATDEPSPESAELLDEVVEVDEVDESVVTSGAVPADDPAALSQPEPARRSRWWQRLFGRKDADIPLETLPALEALPVLDAPEPSFEEMLAAPAEEAEFAALWSEPVTEEAETVAAVATGTFDAAALALTLPGLTHGSGNFIAVTAALSTVHDDTVDGDRMDHDEAGDLPELEQVVEVDAGLDVGVEAVGVIAEAEAEATDEAVAVTADDLDASDVEVDPMEGLIAESELDEESERDVVAETTGDETDDGQDEAVDDVATQIDAIGVDDLVAEGDDIEVILDGEDIEVLVGSRHSATVIDDEDIADWIAESQVPATTMWGRVKAIFGRNAEAESAAGGAFDAKSFAGQGAAESAPGGAEGWGETVEPSLQPATGGPEEPDISHPTLWDEPAPDDVREPLDTGGDVLWIDSLWGNATEERQPVSVAAVGREEAIDASGGVALDDPAGPSGGSGGDDRWDDDGEFLDDVWSDDGGPDAPQASEPDDAAPSLDEVDEPLLEEHLTPDAGALEEAAAVAEEPEYPEIWDGDFKQFTAEEYLRASTTEHVGLAEAIAAQAGEDHELIALSADMPGLESGIVGLDDVADTALPPGEDAGPGNSDLPLRVMTGVLLIGAVAAATWWGTIGLGILIVAVMLGALGEFYTALMRQGHQPAALFGFLGLTGAFLGTAAFGPVAIPFSMVLTSVVLLMFYSLVPRRGDPIVNGGLTLLGLGWVAGFGAFAMDLLQYDTFRWLVFSLVIVTAAMDVAQYFVGRRFGKRKLAPVLSPKKTIEGLVGGVVVGIGIGAALGVIAPFTVLDGTLLGLAIVVVAPIGDLAVSMIKRTIGIKDMGALLPGHGGILDRIDAMLFAIPAAWLMYSWLGLLV